MRTRLPTPLLTIGIGCLALVGCGSSGGDDATIPGVDGDSGTRPPVEIDDASNATTTDSSAATTSTTTSTTSTVAITAARTDPPAVAPATEAPPAPATTIEIVYLRQGDEGPRVATMQRELIALDLLPAGSDSGVFDSATNSALLRFQGQWGLIVDGVYGPETDRSLSAAAQSVAPG